ncbi:MAG: sensor domain-containing diguanylate cyclase [Nitrospirae bacterium]|nr:sensor domain-containing diguanylate cyclase [Nitrospirota bacterium]
MEYTLSVIIISAAVTLVFGFFIGRLLASASYKGKISALEGELQRHNESFQRVSKDQSKQITSLQNETSDISRMIIMFPDIAEDITSSMTIDDLSATIVKVTKQLLDVEEIAFFVAEDEGLLLKTYTGFSKDAAAAMGKIPIGDGRIGWAAKKQIIMFAEDFKTESILIKEQLQQKRAGIRTDVCAPLVHRGKLYGLLSIGKLSKDFRNIKKFLMMITHLSAATMENINLFLEVQHQANIDGLTKLYNITYFHKQLEVELDKAGRFNRNFTVFLFDIDNFKVYNDLNGHPAGDIVLSAIGRLVKEDLRTIDVPARYGGEEFIIMLPETGGDAGLQIAERIRKQIEDLNLIFPQNMPWGRITISGGISTYPVDGKDPKVLIKAADVALYSAKRSGKNKIVPYEQAFAQPD